MSQYKVGDIVRVLGTPWAGKVVAVNAEYQAVSLDVWREEGPFEEHKDCPYHIDEIEKAEGHVHRWRLVNQHCLECECGSTLHSPYLGVDHGP